MAWSWSHSIRIHHANWRNWLHGRGKIWWAIGQKKGFTYPTETIDTNATFYICIHDDSLPMNCCCEHIKTIQNGKTAVVDERVDSTLSLFSYRFFFLFHWNWKKKQFNNTIIWFLHRQCRITIKCIIPFESAAFCILQILLLF